MSIVVAKKRIRGPRHSFTLIELIVVVAIISILAGAVLSAMYGVVEEAKVARTKAQVAKLHELVMSQLEGYGTRPVRLDIPANTTESVVKFATSRLWAIRDLMRMELPDRITDLNSGPTQINIPRDAGGIAAVTPATPSKWRSHRRRAGYTSGSTTPPASWTEAHQGAECLLLIVASLREGESNGLDYFMETEIGDVDEDGMREILDAWGNPIEFLRWAPGYQSEIQPTGAPDPFDPLSVDNRPTYRLVPLIFSSGPDGIYDIITDNGTTPLVNYPTTVPPNDPYVVLPSGAQLGEPADTGNDGQIDDFDNINNHLLDES
jgi:prepilin-type N-terminal cleavage/methylation domain-containing protein